MLSFIVAGIIVADDSLLVVCSDFKCFILFHVFIVKVIVFTLSVAVAVAVINAAKKMKLRREL